MQDIRLFLASSHREEDRPLREFVYKLLASWGFDVKEEAGPSQVDTHESVRQTIESCPVSAFLVTDRGDGRGSTWVDAELGMAVFKGKLVILLVEDSIKDTGFYKDLDGRYVRFKKGDFAGLVTELKKKVDLVVEELGGVGTRVAMSGLAEDFGNPEFRLPEVTKEVWVGPTGHGVILFRNELECLVAGRRSIRLRIGLNSFVPPDVRLPPLDEMMSRGRNLWQQPVLRVQMLAPPTVSGDFDLKCHEEKRGPDGDGNGHDSGREKYLRVAFNTPLEKGWRVKYAWGWSFPGLYLPSTRKGKDGSHYRPDHPVQKLEYRLHLPGRCHGTRFLQVPRFSVHNAYGMLQPALAAARREEDIEYFTYAWCANDLQAGSQCRVEWELG